MHRHKAHTCTPHTRAHDTHTHTHTSSSLQGVLEEAASIEAQMNSTHLAVLQFVEQDQNSTKVRCNFFRGPTIGTCCLTVEFEGSSGCWHWNDDTGGFLHSHTHSVHSHAHIRCWHWNDDTGGFFLWWGRLTARRANVSPFP